MEQLPKSKEGIEVPKVGGIERLSASLETFKTRADKFLESGESKDISLETFKKIKGKTNILKRLGQVVAFSAALGGGISTYNHVNSRYEIKKVERADGTFAYEHEDPETTRIMQYLTGEKPLPEEDKIYFYREKVRDEYVSHQAWFGSNKKIGIDELNSFEKEIPKDYEALKAMLFSIYAEQQQAFGLHEGEDLERKAEEELAEVIEAPIQHDPRFTELLWRLQEKVGAPRIRWAAPGDNSYSSISAHFAGAGRAMYNDGLNTVYLRPGAVGETLIAENAHAYQFNQHPIQYRVRYALDMASTVLTAVRERKTLYEAQLKEYSKPGSVEYEAHEVIEDKLIKEAVDEIEQRYGKEEK